MTNASNIFPVNGEFIWPTLSPRVMASASLMTVIVGDMSKLPGYNEDGDYFQLPSTASGSLTYNNSSDSVVYTLAVTDINAAVDEWGGFLLNDDSDTLYVVGVDLGTTPNTLYTASVDIAGTVTSIGNDQLTTDYADYYPKSNLQINNIGELELRRSTARKSISLSTGVITGEGTSVAINPSNSRSFYTGASDPSHRVTLNGVTDPSTAPLSIFIDAGSGQAAEVLLDHVRANFGVGIIPSGLNAPHIMHWGGYVALVAQDGVNYLSSGPRFFDRLVFDAWIAAMGEVVGV